MKLLSTSNAKLAKGEKFGFLSFGLSLAPSTLSGKNFCSHASAGCKAACLNTSGMGIFKTVQAARLAKSHFFIKDRPSFLAQLDKEILAAIKKSAKLGKRLAVRLNVLSDLPWENLIEMSKYPSVQFYDYTKNIKRMVSFVNGEMPKNYHLTLSRSENSSSAVLVGILRSGGNVAAVFGGTLPKENFGAVVVDGDESDLRFLDPKGVIVGLKAKGDGKKDKSGFVIGSK